MGAEHRPSSLRRNTMYVGFHVDASMKFRLLNVGCANKTALHQRYGGCQHPSVRVTIIAD